MPASPKNARGDCCRQQYDLVNVALSFRVTPVQILTMSSDEDVVFATIAAVSQAKMGLYSPLLEDASNSSSGIGADARTLAKMLVKEEKKVLCDLRQQLMSVVSHRVHFPLRG